MERFGWALEWRGSMSFHETREGAFERVASILDEESNLTLLPMTMYRCMSADDDTVVMKKFATITS